MAQVLGNIGSQKPRDKLWFPCQNGGIGEPGILVSSQFVVGPLVWDASVIIRLTSMYSQNGYPYLFRSVAWESRGRVEKAREKPLNLPFLCIR